MYSRPHHQRIQRVLQSLNTEWLLRQGCLFGGGTAIVLAHGEYRESVDVDFIVSSVAGYRELRSLVNADGIQALMTRPLPVKRDIRIDQYGIRCALDIDGVPIKLEILFEGRVALADPLPEQRIEGVWTLTPEDQVATKLMANSDRWADAAVWSRDLIDLAMLTDGGQAAPAGVAKAMQAYGASVLVDFEKARTQLLEQPGRLKLCMARLQMNTDEPAWRRRLEAMVVGRP